MATYRRVARRAPLAALAVLAVAAPMAEAATKTVIVGPPVKQRPAGFPEDADTNAFYPKVVSIHVGDSVRWDFRAFHTVLLPERGGTVPQLLSENPAQPVAGIADPAGAPFWFNGRPAVGFNPFAFIPAGGASYAGSERAASGAPQGAGPFKPYVLRFSRAGTYRYVCTIHGGNAPMKGVVKVLPKRQRIPSAADDRKTVSAEFGRVMTRLRTDARRAAPAGDVVELGRDSADTALLRPFPASKTVRAGATVTFAMSPKTSEIHTVSFGPSSYVDALAFRPLGGGGGPSAGVPMSLSPIASYPSDPPAAVHSATAHGNGFINTGLLDQDARSAPPSSARVMFSTPGTYGYLCLVHPAMRGQIVVTP